MCLDMMALADAAALGGQPAVVAAPDDGWQLPDNEYVRRMNAWKSRPSLFSVVGKTARTVNLVDFFDWMDEQERLKVEGKPFVRVPGSPA
ncbi:Hypothetical protein NTJ_04825 [Nesidiocoris tenuis]|nr:Hypothetical protein NTJ_04825 [Nesidiocoris tenuis]